MAKVKIAAMRARSKRVSCVKKKTVRQEKMDRAATAGPAISSSEAAAETAPRERIIGDDEDIGALARRYAARAVERLAEIMESDSNREALSAAIHLLERAFGKPAGLADDKNSMNEVMLGLRESLRAKLARIVE
jgi:hypothetical protein